MRRGMLFLLGLIATLAVQASVQATDRIKLLQGQSTGEVVEMSATEVTIELGATTKKHPVNEIESIQFDGEPNELSQARIAVRAGRYSDAEAMLAKIAGKDVKRPEVAKDVEFYRALVAAKLALGGSGSIADAGKKMANFEKANPNNFHHFEACEVVGDLLVALNKPANVYYDKLAKAPWPDYKLRAGVLAGRALISEKKFPEALARFDEVLAGRGEGAQVAAQKQAAALGKAQALASSGKADEALKLVEETIVKADPDDSALYARAYLVQGNCLKLAGKKKEAVLAFLHVDLLYSDHAEQHAEALGNLVTLWGEIDKPERATQTRALLKEKYPSSAWASR